MAEIESIFSKESVDQLIAVAKHMQAVDASINAIKNSQGGAATKTAEYAAAQKQVADASKEQVKAMETLDRQRQKGLETMAKAEAAQRDQEALINKEAKTLQELQKQLLALTKARNQVDVTTKEGAKTVQDYNKRIDENTKKIRENNDSATKQRMNIGNYKSALEGMPGAFGGAVQGASAFGKQLWLLVANPIVAVVAAVVVGLQLLFKAFKSTDDGAKALDKIMGMISATIKVVTQRLSDFANGLIEFFKGNFKDGLNQMGDSFKGIGEQIKSATAAADKYVEAMDKIEDFNVSFISDEAKIREQIADLIYLSKDQNKSDKERQTALEGALALERKIIDVRKGQAVDTYNALIDKVAGLNNVSADYVKKLIEVDAQTAQNLVNTEEYYGFWNKNQEAIKELETAYASVSTVETQFKEESRRAFAAITGFQQEAINKAEEVRQKKLKLMDEEIAYEAGLYTDELALKKQSADDKARVDEEARDRKIALMDEEIAYEAGLYEDELKLKEEKKAKELEDLLTKEEQKKQIEMARAQAATELGEALYTIGSTYTAIAMNDLQKQKDYELQLAGDNAEKKAKIEEKYLAKEKKIKRQQAIMDKSMATFKAAINFAQAIMAALAGGPPPFNIVMAAITAALAGIQLAAIVATPIPQFAKGTRRAGGGLAIVGERGRELIAGPNGMALSPGTASLVNLGRGGQRIYNNRETEMILRATRGADDPSSRRLLDQIHQDNRDIVNAIKNKSELHISANGNRITERTGEYARTYLDKKINW